MTSQYLGGSWIHAVWISFKLQQAFNPKKQPNSFSFSISQHWCATVHNFFVQTSSSVAQIWVVYTFDSQTRWFDLTSVANKVEAHLGPRLPSTMNNIFFLVRSKYRDKENIHYNLFRSLSFWLFWPEEPQQPDRWPRFIIANSVNRILSPFSHYVHPSYVTIVTSHLLSF